MKLDCFEEVKRLTSELVAIPSINKEAHGETAVARYVYDYYMGLPYFQAHPEQVLCFQTKDDFVERHSTMAYVKGTKGTSNRTVILIGHIDTVGVDDFGTIREYAFRTEELPEKLKETFSLSPEVLADIESGEFMFGRGALDILVVPYLKWVVGKIVDQLKGNISDFTELGIVPKLLCRKQVIERRQSEVALSSCHRQTPPLRTQHKPLQQDCSAHTCRCLRPWKQPLRLSLP